MNTSGGDGNGIRARTKSGSQTGDASKVPLLVAALDTVGTPGDVHHAPKPSTRSLLRNALTLADYYFVDGTVVEAILHRTSATNVPSYSSAASTFVPLPRKKWFSLSKQVEGEVNYMRRRDWYMHSIAGIAIAQAFFGAMTVASWTPWMIIVAWTGAWMGRKSREPSRTKMTWVQRHLYLQILIMITTFVTAGYISLALINCYLEQAGATDPDMLGPLPDQPDTWCGLPTGDEVFGATMDTAYSAVVLSANFFVAGAMAFFTWLLKRSFRHELGMYIEKKVMADSGPGGMVRNIGDPKLSADARALAARDMVAWLMQAPRTNIEALLQEHPLPVFHRALKPSMPIRDEAPVQIYVARAISIIGRHSATVREGISHAGLPSKLIALWAALPPPAGTKSMQKRMASAYKTAQKRAKKKYGKAAAQKFKGKPSGVPEGSVDSPMVIRLRSEVVSALAVLTGNPTWAPVSAEGPGMPPKAALKKAAKMHKAEQARKIKYHTVGDANDGMVDDTDLGTEVDDSLPAPEVAGSIPETEEPIRMSIVTINKGMLTKNLWQMLRVPGDTSHAAARLISGLTRSEATRQTLAALPSIARRLFEHALEENPSPSGLCVEKGTSEEACLGLLEFVANIDDVCFDLASRFGVDAVLRLVHSKATPNRRCGLALMSALTLEEAYARPLEKEISLLIKSTEHEDALIARFAVSCLADVAGRPDLSAKIGVRGMDAIVALGSSPDVEVQLQALRCLAILTHNDRNRELLVECLAPGVYPAEFHPLQDRVGLVALFKSARSPDEEVVKCSAATLANLSAATESFVSQVLVSSGVGPVLQGLLRNPSPEIQSYAFAALHRLNLMKR